MADPDTIPEPYDAGDPRQVRDRRQREKVQQGRADGAFVRLMGTADGRLWVWRVLASCGVFRSSFDQSAARMSFNEGRRDIGLQLMAEITRLCPELYGVMQKECSDNG